jgi:hypothetical protein
MNMLVFWFAFLVLEGGGLLRVNALLIPIMKGGGGTPQRVHQYIRYETIAPRCAHRHIHSLELLEGIRTARGEAFLTLGASEAPKQTGRFVHTRVAAMLCGGVPVELQLVGDRPHRAEVLCLYRGEPLLVYRLTVRGLPADGRGHMLVLTVQYLRCRRALERLTRPLHYFLYFFEDLMALRPPPAMRRDANLVLHRLMLGVPEA